MEKRRYISLDGCPIIGEGKHAKVYRLNDEQIVKVYYDNTTLEEVEAERKNARTAFVQGAPSYITFDLVETDQGHGIVFELANGQPLGSYITEHPEELETCAAKFAGLMHTLHAIEGSPPKFGSIKDFYIESYRMTPEKYFSRRDVDTLVSIVEALPDANHLIHNDIHTQNVFIDAKKQLMLIDMADISYGHPIVDLGCTYMLLVFSARLLPSLGRSVTGLSKKHAEAFWDIVFRQYLQTDDTERLRHYERLCKYMRNMRLATLITRTSVFPAIAYRACALWTKVFVISQAQKYIEAFRAIEA